MSSGMHKRLINNDHERPKMPLDAVAFHYKCDKAEVYHGIV